MMNSNNNPSPRYKKWTGKCLNDDEFNDAVAVDEEVFGIIKEDSRGGDDVVAERRVTSKDVSFLTRCIKNTCIKNESVVAGDGVIGQPSRRYVSSTTTTTTTTTRTTTTTTTTNTTTTNTTTTGTTLRSEANNPEAEASISYASDLSGDEWSLKENLEEIGEIINQLGRDRPDHVRLDAYEVLLENDLTNLTASDSWEALLKTLKDGLIDGSRSIFEASLLVHARLLSFTPNLYLVFMNLLNAFTEQCASKRFFDALPTILTGVNFKIFLHEKLFRIMKLIVDQQEEIVKGMRANDKAVDEVMEQFVCFLCTRRATSPPPTKSLNTLNVISIIEPRASWSRKWLHGLMTRKVLCSAIAKSPGFVRNVIEQVNRGLVSPPLGISVAITDERHDVFVSGDSVEALTFLHCLCLLTQLCGSTTGRSLLSDTQSEESFSIPNFLKVLLDFLNALALSEASNSVYESVRHALRELLNKPVVLYDARFYRAALGPLLQPEVKIWPHTLDVLNHMLDTPEGPVFLMTKYKASLSPSRKRSHSEDYPIVIVLKYASDFLRQPVSVISTEHLDDFYGFVGKLFSLPDIFYYVQETLREYFYPSLAHMYSKLDRYYIENERKAQKLDKAVKGMLLNVLSLPLCLQMLSNQPLAIKELICGSISSLRTMWSNYSVSGFISNCGFFARGVNVLLKLTPYVLSTLIHDLTKILEDPQHFHDPWENSSIKVFLHVLALFSLNTHCFIAFMKKNECKEDEARESEEPSNLQELLENVINIDSLYHHLGLLALKVIIWNLDLYVYLLELLDFEDGPDRDESRTYIISESSALRHTILLNTYFVRHKRNESVSIPEGGCLFSKLPPPKGIDDGIVPQTTSSSSHPLLTSWLRDSSSAPKDSNWILQTQKAHKASPNPIQNSLLMELIDRASEAVPANVEWCSQFNWDSTNYQSKESNWLAEEKRAIDFVLHYGTINGLLNKTEEDARTRLRIFIRSAHDFINHEKSARFDGFDWFLATAFLICGGDLHKSKIFVSQMLRFPATTFMWLNLARVVDKSNDQEASTKLLFAQLLDNIVDHEFPTIKFALKNECGLDWWMICDRLMTQCFWGILPWTEIVHYFAICVLHPPDYVLYYCASLLNHCQTDIRNNILKGKVWPEDMVFEDYRCYSQMGFMDRLAKRYGAKVLPPLMQQKLLFSRQS